MPFNAAEERERQRRIRGSEDTRRVAQPVRSEVPVWQPSWIPVVLRSVNAAAQEMWFHLLRYADKPPVVGSYEAYGPLQRGYPFPTMDYTQYQSWIWPETIQVDGEAVDNPITTETMPVLATRARGSWILMIPLKETTGATRGTYVFGGIGPLCPGDANAWLSTNDLYTPDRWTARAPLVCTERATHAATTIGGAIYSFGGATVEHRISNNDEYTPDAWRTRRSVPAPIRDKSAAFALEDKGYLSGGGYALGGDALIDFDEYTPPPTDTWNTRLQPLPRKTREHAAFSLGSAGYIVGGVGSEVGYSNFTDRYKSGVWTTVRELPIPGGRANLAAFVIGEIGYVTGGEQPAGLRVLDTVQAYDPSNDSWTTMQPMLPPGRCNHTAAAIGEAGFVHGGLDRDGLIDDTDEYTPGPSGGSWASRVPMPAPKRFDAAAATL